MKFARYIAVQLIAYGLDMGGFLFMSSFFGAGTILSNISGKVVAGLFAFFAHRHFTFVATKEEKYGRQAGMYFAVLALNIPLSSAALMLVLLAVSPPALAKLIADAICVFLSYWLSKTYVFSRKCKNLADSTLQQEHV
jgi:putative flippase GtrA